MGVFGNPRLRRKGLVFFTILAALLTAGAGFLLMHRLQLESVQSIRQDMQAWQPVLGTVRVTVILLVALGWNRLVAVLTNTGILHPARAGQLAALRWRIVAWMVVLELVLGQGVLARIVQLATGTGS